MTKCIVSVCITLSWVQSNAQIVFDLPSAIPTNETEILLLWNGNSTAVTTSGSNILWDFTNVVTSEPDAVTYLTSDPDSTVLDTAFASATHAHGYTLAQDTIWNYYRLGGDTLWHLGGDYGDVLLCSAPRLAMVFPYAFGDLAVNTATCTYGMGPAINPNYGFEPVATGTIVYPAGTIPNVVLMRKHENGVPTDHYHWYRVDNVFTSVGHFYNFGVDLWVPVSTSGVNDLNGQSALSVFPLPADNDVTVVFDINVSNASYRLLDATGRDVATGFLRPGGNRIQLDVSLLSNGQYNLLLQNDEVRRRARIMVAH